MTERTSPAYHLRRARWAGEQSNSDQGDRFGAGTMVRD